MIRMMVLIWITNYMYIMNHIKKHEKTSYTLLYGYMVSKMGCSGRVLRVFLVRYDGHTCKNIAQGGRITLYMTSTMSPEKIFFLTLPPWHLCTWCTPVWSCVPLVTCTKKCRSIQASPSAKKMTGALGLGWSIGFQDAQTKKNLNVHRIHGSWCQTSTLITSSADSELTSHQ